PGAARGRRRRTRAGAPAARRRRARRALRRPAALDAAVRRRAPGPRAAAAGGCGVIRRLRRLSPAATDALLAAAIGIAGVVEFLARVPAADRTPLAGITLAGAYACV